MVWLERAASVELVTFGGDDVGLTDVLRLFRLDLGGGITRFGGGGLVLRHLNLVAS